jgi:excisionase family DNA binding protein
MDELLLRLTAIEEKLSLLLGTSTLMTAQQAADYLGLSVARIRTLTQKREIPHYKQGRRVSYDKAELDDWRRCRRVQTKDEITREAQSYVTVTASDFLNRKKK